MVDLGEGAASCECSTPVHLMECLTPLPSEEGTTSAFLGFLPECQGQELAPVVLCAPDLLNSSVCQINSNGFDLCVPDLLECI